MKIPTESEYRITQRKKRINFGCGFLIGLFFFGLAGIRAYSAMNGEMPLYIPLLLLFGIFSFAFLAARFGDDFWNAITG